VQGGGALGRGRGFAAGGRVQVRAQHQLRGGTVRPDRLGGGRRSTLAGPAERLPALLAAEPDLTIAELRRRLAAAGIAASRSAIGRFLAAWGLTRAPAGAEPGAPRGPRRDRGHDRHGATLRPSPPRRAGGRRRAPRPLENHDLPGGAPSRRSHRALRLRRRDRRRALVGVRRAGLAPTLRPGDIVVMDNLGADKVAGGRQAIAAVGAELLCLPPHSPDLNPIEMCGWRRCAAGS
jgi:DDE superfamily endonuclease